MTELIKKIELVNSTGMYQFPFLPSFNAECIINENITYKEFFNHKESQYAKEYNGKKHKYTEKEKQSIWLCILDQRLRYRAIKLVIEGKFIAFNPALRSLGVKN